MLDLLNEGNFKMFYIFTGQVMEIMAWKPRQRVVGAEEESERIKDLNWNNEGWREGVLPRRAE